MSMILDCIDIPNSLHALIGVSLILAGSNLMMQANRIPRGYGSYCFALGYLILGLSAVDRDVGTLDLTSRRYLLGVGSIVAIVAGTFMMYYHVQDRVRDMLKNGLPQLSTDAIVKSIPVIDNVLVYLGYAGLVVAIAMREDMTFNLVKGAMALVALLVIGYTKTNMLQASINGVELEKHQLSHFLSWGLLILAIGYSC